MRRSLRLSPGLEGARGQPLSAGSAGSFWLAGDVRQLRYARFRAHKQATAWMASNRARLIADLEQMRWPEAVTHQ